MQFWSEICGFYFVDTRLRDGETSGCAAKSRSHVFRNQMTNRKPMKYLRLIPALLLGAMLTACNTTKKLYEAQQYDQVIQRVAPEVCQGKMNDKDLNYVAASYHKANQADHERIQALKASGQPDVWPEIYQRYCSMKGRNDALKCFPSKVKKGMNYVKLDLDDDLIAARNKAENYLVAKTNLLLNTDPKANAAEAEKCIEQLKCSNRENPQLLNLQKKLALYSTESVEFGFLSDYNLPTDFQDVVFSFEENELPREILGIHVLKKPKHPFAYVVVKQVSISPMRLDEVTFKENKNDKSVDVTDHSQNKSVTVSGYIRYFANDAKRELGVVPFEVKSTFKNDYTTIKGDREACSAETLSRLDSHPVPVPTDESMLIDAAKKLNDLIAAELNK